MVITVAFWGSYEEWGMWREIIDLFQAKNPGIFVKMNYIPNGYDDKMRLLLAADSAPDIMLIQDEPFPAYASYGKFADLTEWVRAPETPFDWETSFWPTSAESFVYKDRIMGLPIWGGNVLLYYNREMLREMGVEPPPDDWDYDQFIAKAKEVTRDTNGDGRLDSFGFTLPYWVYYLPLTWGFGASYLNEAHTDWTFTGPEAVASLQFFQDLLYKYRVCPSIQEVPTGQEGAMFMTGRVAMNMNGPWFSPGLKTAGIDFDVAHIPRGPNGQRYTRVTWDALCLFDKSPHKKEAWEFMKHCAGLEAQNIVGRYIRSIPALIAAKDSFCDANNGWSEEKFIEAMDYARLQPISSAWFAMNNVINPVYELVHLRKITPEQAIEQMDREMRLQNVFPIKEDE